MELHIGFRFGDKVTEKMTLTAPEIYPSLVDWKVLSFFANSSTPVIKVEFIDNNGKTKLWLYIVNSTTTIIQVKNAISYINQGKFKTIDNISLEKWLIQQAQSRGILPTGNISGVVD